MYTILRSNYYGPSTAFGNPNTCLRINAPSVATGEVLCCSLANYSSTRLHRYLYIREFASRTAMFRLFITRFTLQQSSSSSSSGQRVSHRTFYAYPNEIDRVSRPTDINHVRMTNICVYALNLYLRQ